MVEVEEVVVVVVVVVEEKVMVVVVNEHTVPREPILSIALAVLATTAFFIRWLDVIARRHITGSM